MDNLSILMVVHDFLPRVVAGTEIHVLRLSAALDGRCDVRVFHTVRDAARAQYSTRDGRFDRIDTTSVVQNYPYQPLGAAIRHRAMERVFERVLARVRPSIVHFHHLAYLPLSLPDIAAKRGCRTLFTLHDYFLGCPSGGQLAAHPDGRICEGPQPDRCAPCHAAYCSREGRLEAIALRLAQVPGMPAELPFRVYHRLPVSWKGVLKRLNPRPGTGKNTAETAQRNLIVSRWDHVVRLFHGVDRFVAPSQDLATRFISWGLPNDKVLHLPNPAPTHLRVAPLPPRPPVRLLFVGTLAPHKGLEPVLTAASRFSTGQLRLVVVGDPDGFPVYSSRCRGLAGSNVRFAGRCAREGVQRELENTHALVLGSLWPENAPLTILEALATGRPVIAPRIGGAPELIEDGRNGLLYPAGDATALEAVMRRLISSRTLLTTLAGAIEPPPDDEWYSRQIEELYEEICADRLMISNNGSGLADSLS